MELELRLILLFGAVLTMAYFIRQIQKKRMQIDYAIYWALFSGALVVLAAFPGIATFGAAYSVAGKSDLSLPDFCLNY